MADSGLYGPFNTRAEAHEYALLTGIQGYEVLHEDEAQRLNEPEVWDNLHPKRHTKS